jgi:hypothetical protein
MLLHANAALSLKKRLLLCERVVEQEWTLTKVAEAALTSSKRLSSSRVVALMHSLHQQLAPHASTPAVEPLTHSLSTADAPGRLAAIESLRPKPSTAGSPVASVACRRMRALPAHA